MEGGTGLSLVIYSIHFSAVSKMITKATLNINIFNSSELTNVSMFTVTDVVIRLLAH